jgi:hypothetical protein
LKLQESELRERKPEPTEFLSEQEPVWLGLENRLAPAQARGQPGRWPRALALGQTRLLELLERTKNSVRLPRSLRAWATLGREVRFVRQAFLEEGTSLPA